MADNLQYQQFNASKKYVSDAEFTSLDTSTIPVGTEYNIVGVIEESDLSSDLQTKINKTVTIEQTTGSNTGTVMSQKAVTEELGLKQPLIDASTTLNLNSVVGSGTIQGNTIVAQSDMRAYATLNPSSLNFTRSDETPTIVTDNSTLTIPSNKTGTIALTSDIPASLIPGDNISITKASDSEKVTISATGLVKHNTDLSSQADLVYGQTYNGTDISYQIGQNSNNENTIARRTSYGSIRTADPKQYNDAVSKQYFEAKGVLRELQEITNPTADVFKSLKTGLYKITSKATTGFTDDLTEGYYTVLVNHYATNECTLFVQTVNQADTYFAYIGNVAGVNGFYKLASTSDVATATAVLIDNSLIGG